MTVVNFPKSAASKEAEAKRKAAARYTVNLIDRIGTMSLRIQVAESSGLEAVAEGWRERKAKMEAELKEISDLMNTPSATKH